MDELQCNLLIERSPTKTLSVQFHLYDPLEKIENYGWKASVIVRVKGSANFKGRPKEILGVDGIVLYHDYSVHTVL